MDSARVVHVDSGPPPPRKGHRLLIMLVVAAFAAPLASGSAASVTGGSGDEGWAPYKAPVAKQKHDGRDCHRGEGRMHRRGTVEF
jgi:hypothetical protein